MRIEKIVILLLAVFSFSLTAKAQTKKTIQQPQFEYATYSVLTIPCAERLYRWQTPYENIWWIYEFNDNDSEFDFWHLAGFKFGYRNVYITDWFNFLAQEGWQLDRIENEYNDVYYWFKRTRAD